MEDIKPSFNEESFRKEMENTIKRQVGDRTHEDGVINKMVDLIYHKKNSSAEEFEQATKETTELLNKVTSSITDALRKANDKQSILDIVEKQLNPPSTVYIPLKDRNDMERAFSLFKGRSPHALFYEKIILKLLEK
jgi:hypothetical protein